LVDESSTRHSLYPFNEGTNVVSKALLPVGNVPIISHVLDWVLDGGIMGESRDANDG
jgi:dTDP-glucose pyrophosphorylase